MFFYYNSRQASRWTKLFVLFVNLSVEDELDLIYMQPSQLITLWISTIEGDEL